MPPSLQSLGIDRMTIEDRIALALAIWDSIDDQPHSPLLTEAQRQELQPVWPTMRPTRMT